MRLKALLVIFIAFLIAVSSPLTFAKTKKKVASSCPEGFTCIKVKRNQSWQSLFPDERERGIVMRINHRNGELWPGIVLRVPDNLSEADLLDFSPFPPEIDPPSEKVVVFDPKLDAWGAYDADGSLVRWGPATGGKDWCDDVDGSCRTKSGTFRIYSLGSSNCVSTKFPLPDGGAPMPYCMFFNGGQAFHGSPGGVIKGNASHGCVRMFVQDAEWLRYDFVEPPMPENGYRGTKVVILPYKKPLVYPDEITETYDPYIEF